MPCGSPLSLGSTEPPASPNPASVAVAKLLWRPKKYYLQSHSAGTGTGLENLTEKAGTGGPSLNTTVPSSPILFLPKGAQQVM